MEYLDERFPHPPLLPVFPVSKAKTRVAIHRINEDWYTQMRIILNSNASVGEVEAARKRLTDSLTSITPVFVEMPFFLSEEFTLIDCCMAPLLWRLELMQIKLPAPAKAVLDYAHRLFELECFQKSLTEKERTMRW
jgi:RNA polymerase-associated protein